MNKTNLLLVIIFLSAAFFCAAIGVASAITLSEKYVGNTVVDLEWSEWPVWPDGFSKYELYRDDNIIHTELNRSNTFYRDEGLSKGNGYNYEIKVYNASGGLVGGDKETVTTGEVHGTITQSTTWTSATSPYGLTGTVIVDEGATLTIQPGVTVNGGLIDIKGTITPLDTVTFNGSKGLVLGDVDGFSIKNCVFENAKSCGILLYGEGNNTLTNNIASNNGNYGICLFGGNNTLTNNIASNNGYGGIDLSEDNNALTGNTASNNGHHGILLYGEGNNTLTNNIASNNGYDGILLLYGEDNNALTGNTASNNGYYGICLYGDNNTLTNNIASNNSYGCGIYTDYGNNNALTGNTASNNGKYGIYLPGGNNNTLTDNIASNNSYYGIKLDGASNNNTIYNNYFNNTHNAYDDGNNIWNITKTPGKNIVGGPYLGGNYWSDYAGADIDGDGLGDTSLPYNCSEQIAHGGDYRPLTVSLAFRASTHYHLPHTYVLLYTELENVTGYEQCSCSNIAAYVVVNNKISDALLMKNDGAGLGSRDHPDFIADDCHFSLWLPPESLGKAEKYVLDLYVTEKPFFEKESAHKVDTIELERKSDPKLLVLTDFRELFKEFEKTARGSSSADENQNCIRDYYEAVDRLQEYATAHNGTVVDVRKDAYTRDHSYYSGYVCREPMWKDIDTMISKLPDTMKNTIKFIAIIGDDAVVPFYRVDVLSGCTEEADNYVHNEIGTGPKGQKTYKGNNPTLLDIANRRDSPNGHWMSDIPYGTFKGKCLDVGLGRIFRDKPLELVQLIDAFEQPLDLRTGQSRTFILNSWNEREDKKIQFHEIAVDTLVPPVKRHYGGITRENTLPRKFVGNYPAGGHWVTGENLNWDAWDIWRVKWQTDLLVLLSHGRHWKHQDGQCKWIPFETLSNWRGVPATYRLLVIGSCHCGLNIARHDGHMWKEMLCRQALSVNSAFFGTTSYDTGSARIYDSYHERMRRLFLERLFSPTTHTLGDVLQQAHGCYYYRSCGFWGLKDNDRKVLYTVELYGLPTQPVITRRAAQAQGTGIKALPIQSTEMMSDGFKQLTAKNQSSNRTVVISHFEVVEDEQGRVLFAVPHNGRLGGVEFAPILPMVHHSYLLPYDATNVSVVLTSNQSHFYDRTVEMVPLIPVSKSFGPLNGTANITNPYPESVLNYSTSPDIGGLRLDVLLVPLQYNPDTGQVTLYDRLDYKVSYTATANVTVNKIEVNDGNPVNIDLTDVPINVTISAAEPLNGALLWEIRDAAGNLVDIDYGTIDIEGGTSQVSLSVNTVGWEPGPKQFMVQLYDAYSESETGRVVASGQKCFTAIGTSLKVSSNDSIYGSSNISATVIAVVRNETGAKVSGLANNFTQKLGGNETTLVWSEGADGYTTSLELTDIVSGQHNLSVFVNGCAAETRFLVDRNPPTSTASSPAEVYTSAFKVRISRDDNVSAVDEYYVQYRVGENGTWIDWLMRIGGFDYSHTDQDNLEPIFGPTEPINVTEGTTYCFRVNAVDYAGNLEEIHTEADTCTTYVAEAKVVINEVYPNPVADGGEWIEFYNDGEVDLNLTGWRIVNGDDELDYSIPANSSDWDGILESDSYLVLHLGGTLDTPAEDLCAGIAYGVLGNEDDSVSLLSDDNIGVDFVRYGNWTDDPPTGTSWTGMNPDAPVQGQSLGRDKDSTDTDDGSDWENTGGVDADGPTPGEQNLREGQPPDITSFAPPSPVNDNVCNWRTFNVTVDQTVDVRWYLDDLHQQTNDSVREASFTLHAVVPGEHNVTVEASNANGTDLQTWIWNVTGQPTCDGTNTSCGIYPNCENCNEYDGCYVYGNGCEERDYYCKSNEEGCNYTYSNRRTDYHDDFVNYCKGDEVWKRRLLHDLYCDNCSCTDHTSWVDDQLVDNCNDHDGWYCKDDTREYRDYKCSNGSCTYTIISSENCSELDGCYVYGNGCEDRDYYCSGGACEYMYSNRQTDYYDDLVNYCKGDEVWKRRLLHNFSCDNGSCTDHTSWVDDQLVENCSTQCTTNNTLKTCYNGNCTDTGICNTTICSADAACDGKKPGETCGDSRICNSTCNCVLAPPIIFSYAPESPVNDSQGATRTFNITINQTVNVSWQINSTVVQTDEGVTEASYTNLSAVIGTWNVSVIVNNVTGIDMQTWVWTVEPSPCFIATAAYGTPLHEDIDVLRDFRDEYLMTNLPGRAFVNIYYSSSPPLADAIRANECLGTAVREGFVKPVVHISRMFVLWADKSRSFFDANANLRSTPYRFHIAHI